MKPIHLAIASTTSKPGLAADNLRQIAGFADQAARDGADLLLTPELSASGYGPYPEVLATAEPAGDGPLFRELAGMAARTGVVICAGFVEAAGGRRHIAHYAVQPDGRFVVQRKHRVTTADLRSEAGRATYLRVMESVFFPGAAVTDCIQHRRAMAAVNLCGWDGRQHYHVGHGMIITPMGEVPALFHGLPNLDRQRPAYAHAIVDVDEVVCRSGVRQ